MDLTRFGEYILSQQLSAGGMAEVFLASTADGRTVVIRRLNPRFKFNFFRRRDFMAGVKIHARLRHPNIVQILQMGSHKWLPYVVMEHHEGINLRQAFGRRGEFLADPVPIFEKMLAGLDYLHRQRLMHMDFKPENIFLTHDGNLKLFDFDLARPIPRKPAMLLTVKGTPSYLAPEIILKEPVDERADIFALGITSYELFTGQKPFMGAGSSDVFRAYTDFNTPFPSPQRANASLPARLCNILMRCVEKRVERRYPSIAMVQKDLNAFKAGTPG